MTSQNNKTGMMKTAVFMVVVTLSAKVLGLLRDMLLASFYATSPEAVAYDTASRLPLIIFDFVIGGVITATFIPVFNEILVKKNKKEALSFAVSYFNVILLLCISIAVLGVVLAEPLVSFLAPDIPLKTARLAVSLTRIMFPMIIFTGMAFSFVGFLQSLGSFLLPSVISLVSNLIMVLYFVFFNKSFGIYGLAAAMTIGWAAQALIQLPTVIKKGFRYSLRLDFKSEYIRRAFSMALPILVSSWVQPFCNLINTRYASDIEGGISAMGYANRLYLIIVGLFAFVATNLLFPYFSKAEAAGDREENQRLTRTSVKTLMLVILPITFGIFALSEPIISAVFERGQFDVSDVKMTAEAFRFFSLGMPFYAVNEVCTKKFFAEQRTLPPMITALASIACNFAFVALLSDKMGLAGIALASALAVAVNTALNICVRYSYGDKLFALKDIIDILIMLVSAAVMGYAVYRMNCYPEYGIIGLCVNVLAGAVLYFIICFILSEELTRSAVGKMFKTKRRN